MTAPSKIMATATVMYWPKVASIVVGVEVGLVVGLGVAVGVGGIVELVLLLDLARYLRFGLVPNWLLVLEYMGMIRL